jgi:hypothetical protein
MKMTAALLTVLVLLASGRDAMSQSSKNEPAGVTKAAQPAIEFGHEGGNLRPYKIAVFEDGRIEVIEGSPALKSHSISAEKIKDLVQKASHKNFWKSSHIDERPALPDFGFVFVKVKTASGRIINHKGAQIGPLAEYYSLLTDLVLQNP